MRGAKFGRGPKWKPIDAEPINSPASLMALHEHWNHDDADEILQKVQNHGRDQTARAQVHQGEEQPQEPDRRDTGLAFIAVTERENDGRDDHGEGHAAARVFQAQEEITSKDRLFGHGHHADKQHG